MASNFESAARAASTATTTVETVPTTWSDSDEQFFRVAAALFAPEYLRGAGVLLASYDDEVEPAAVSPLTHAPVVPITSAAVPVAP